MIFSTIPTSNQHQHRPLSSRNADFANENQPEDQSHIYEDVLHSYDRHTWHASDTNDSEANYTLKTGQVKNLEDLRIKTGFIENKGQWTDSNTNFHLDKDEFEVTLANDHFVYTFHYYLRTDAGNKYFSERVAVNLLHSNPDPVISTEVKGTDYRNYILGTKHITRVHHYQQVTYHDVYDGIDIIFEASNPDQKNFGFKYSFVVHPHADPHQIKLRYEGSDHLKLANSHIRIKDGSSIGNSGVLKIPTGAGEVGEQLSEVFTVRNGIRAMVDAEFDIQDGDQVKFKVGQYDRGQKLIIDPNVIRVSLRQSTYYGSSDKEQLTAIDSDSDGNVFVVGITESTQEPRLSKNGIQNEPNGGNEIIVAKFTSDLSELESATYLGGANDDQGFDIDVDNENTVTITGYTTSPDFPAQDGSTYGSEGGTDLIVVNLSNDLATLNWTYGLGGSSGERANAVFTTEDAIYVAANAASSGLNTIGNDYNGSPVSEALLLKLSKGGDEEWATYNGDVVDSDSEGGGIVVANSEVILSGKYYDPDQDEDRLFISKYDLNGNKLTQELFADQNILGVTDLAISPSQEKLGVVGSISGRVGRDQSNLINATHQPNYGGGSSDGFAFQINTNDLSVDWSTYYGAVGDDTDRGDALLSVTFDCNNNLVASGYTTSPNGISDNGFINDYRGGAQNATDFGDAFMVKFDNAGNRYWGSYFGAAVNEAGQGLALSQDGNILLCGVTSSQDGIATDGTFDSSYNVGNEGFISTFCDLIIDKVPVSKTVTLGSNVSFSIGTDFCGSIDGYSWTRNLIRLSDNDNISGSGTSQLDLTGVTTSDEGEYCVTINTACGEETLCAFLTIVSLSANSVCLDSLTTPGNPSGNQESIMLTFPNLEDNEAITNATYGWSVTADDGNVSGASDVISGSNGTFSATLPITDEDLYELEIAPTVAGTYTYTLILNYEDSRRDPSSISDQISTTINVHQFPTFTNIAPNPVSICTEERTSVQLTTDIEISRVVWELIDDASGTVSIRAGTTGTINVAPIASSATFDQQFLLSDGVTTPQTAIVQVTPYTSNGCPGGIWTFEVEVKPGPVILTDIPEDIVCNNQELVIDVSTLPDFDGTNFSWIREADDDILPIPDDPGGSFVTAGEIRETLENTSNGSIDVNYNISGDFDGCGPEALVSVTVLPTAQPNFENPDVLCNGGAFNVTISTGIVDSRSVGYKIVPGDNEQITGMTQVNEYGFDRLRNYNFNGTLTNTSVELQQATFSVTAYMLIESDTCFGVTEELLISIEPEPNIIAANQSLCSGNQLTLPVRSDVSNAEITWEMVSNSAVIVDGETSGTITTSGNIEQREIRLADESSISGVDITYNLSSSINGCPGESTSLIVRVNPNPVVDISGDDIICGDDPILLSASSNLTDVDWQWFLGEDEITDATNESIQVSVPGVYSARATTTDGSSCDGTSQIDVSRQDLVDIDPITASSDPNGVCAADGVELTVAVTGTPSIQWQFEDSGTFVDITGATQLSYLALESGRYRVRVNPGNICEQLSDDIEIDFAPVPQLSLAAPNPTVCPEEQVVLTGGIVTNGATLTDTLWRITPDDAVISNRNSLNPIISFPLNNTGVSIDYEAYLLIDTDFGCKDSIKVDLTLSPAPLASFEIDQSLCGGATASITNLSELADTYQWSVNNPDVNISGAGEANPTFSFPENSGTTAISYDIQLEVVSALGCQDDTTVVVEVFPEPTMVIDGFVGPDCTPYNLVVNSSNLSNSNDGSDFTRVEWYLDGVSQSRSEVFERELINGGTTERQFRLTLEGETSNGCIAQVSTDVLIYPDARAEFTATTTTSCAPFNTWENNNISLTEYPDANSNYRWEVIENGSIVLTQEGIEPPEFVIENPNTTISLRLNAISRNGCFDDATTINFSSFDEPVPSFAVLSEVCAGDMVDFSNTSTLTGGGVLPEDASIRWDFGDGVTSSERSPTHIFSTTDELTDQEYNVQLSVTYNGCTRIESTLVNVHPLPLSRFSLGGGCGSDLLSPINNSSGKGNLSYRWSAEPSDGISFSDLTVENPEITVSTVVSTDIEYQIFLQTTSEDRCVSVSEQSLVVFGTPEAIIQADPLICANEVVVFESVVPIESSLLAPDSLYIWDYGDGTIDTVQAPNRRTEHIYITTTNYTLSLTIVNTEGCTDETSTTLRVIDTPQADFTKVLRSSDERGGPATITIEGKDEDEICGPFVEADFTDLSVIFNEGETYLWNFGRGENDTSTLVNPPTVFYEQSVADDTTYTVTLIVTNQCESDTIQDNIIIRPIPTAAFNFQFEVGCDEVPVTIFNNSLGAPQQYIFDYGDGSPREVFNESNPIQHTFFAPNQRDTTYTIKLIAENICGLDSTTRDIRIIPNDIRAAISIAADDDLFCENEEITFVANGYIDPTASITWNFGDGTVAFSQDTVMHEYDEAGTYAVSLELFIPSCGATSRAEIELTIDDSPDIAFETNDSICLNDFLTISNVGTDQVISTLWDLGDGTIYQGIEPPDHSYDAPGNYIITMSVANAIGCETVLQQPVEVRALPVADFTVPDLICEKSPVVLTNVSTGAESYQWEVIELGDLNISENYEDVFDTAGVYTVRLTAYDRPNRTGCQQTTTRSITVHPNPKPAFSVSASKACQDSTFTITNLSEGSLTDRWSLADQQTGEIVSILEEGIGIEEFDVNIRVPGAYLVNLESTSSEGCTAETQQVFSIVPNPQIELDSLITEVCQGYEYQYINRTSLPDSISGQFRWYVDGDLRASTYQLFPQTFPKRQGENYTVNLRLEAQNDICVASNERDILIPGYLGCNYFFPTAFSPNGDGQNDRAYIEFHQNDIENVVSVKLQVYTITDHLVYNLEISRNGPGEDMDCVKGCGFDFDPEFWFQSAYWDGDVPVLSEDNRGLYWFVLQVECCNRHAPETTGYVQLLR